MKYPFKIFISVLALTLIQFVAFSPDARAGQCGNGDPSVIDCTQNGDQDCLKDGCNPCVRCNPNTNTCFADDSFCQANSGGSQENVCRDAACIFIVDMFPDETGCDYEAPALTGDTSLEEICYYCDPPVLAVDTCGNGVCDGPGETCQNCPLDCLVPGFEDINGNSCPVPQADLDFACTAFITFPGGPPYNQGGSGGPCEDGDICTNNICSNGDDDDDVVAQGIGCQVSPKTCDPVAQDLCCPSGCQGIPPGFDNCRTAEANDAIDINVCDPDCWPAQSCGDNFVQNANQGGVETCDDGVPGPNAGLLPDGSTISEADCRDPGTQNECTFCGDNIINSPSEECDGTAANECGLGECNSSCQCVFDPDEVLCLKGGGIRIGDLEIDCETCSLNKNATPKGWTDYVGTLGLLLLVGLGLALRRRQA